MDAHKTGPKGLKRPRLTPLDRLQIEAGLQNGESPYSIARRIGHDLKTMLREIRDRARTIKTGVACRLSNKCVHAVMVNNASLFTFCDKSAYRYINGGLLMTKRGHEFIRHVLPKATPYTEAASFDDLTQEDVNLLMSHINSYPRKAL